jgi:hypothetical protein
VYSARAMFTLFVSLLFSVPTCFRTRAALQAEILALRHQLLVLQRSSRGHRLRLSSADRVLWVWLSRLWTEWRSALIIVKPETVIGWHQPHLSLDKDAPIPRAVQPPEFGTVMKLPEVGGLHHRYERRVA